MQANYHTHTWRCRHAAGEEREYIETAVKAGIRELGFSDHSPYPFEPGYESNFRMTLEQTAGYFETLRALQEEYADRITIRIGFEAEYYPRFFGEMREFVRSFDCDYLIMGQHFLQNEIERIYSGSATDDEARLAQYVEQVCEGLATGAYTYLAHPDLPAWQGGAAAYDRQMRRLCEETKAMGIPLEINLLGQYEHRFYPYERFWQLAGECGCEVILGCDAHEPSALNRPDTEQEALAMAQRCGLKVLPRMEKLRKP